MEKVTENIKKLILNEVHTNRHGTKVIALDNYAKDFKSEFAFLGFTKNGKKIKLGEIYYSGPDGEKWKNKIGDVIIEAGKVRIRTDGGRFSKRIPFQKEETNDKIQ